MLSKTVHLRPLKCSSVIHVKTPEKEARIHERNSIIEPDFEYKPIQKTAYDSNIYKFQREKLSKPANPSDIQLPPTTYYSAKSESQGPELLPCHAPDYFIIKKKKYNEQAQIINTVPLSNVISQQQYKTLRSTSLGFSLTPAAERGEEADRRNVYRRNLFISKANEINQDFKFQPLIRNAQTTSEDTPYWFQGTAKFFTKESSDLTKKMRSTLKDLPKADIFGKPDVEYPKTEYPFVAKPPSKGQRYELNKMVIVDKVHEVKSARANHVQLKWEEEPEKQAYDKARLTWKIGNGKPVIKKLEAKAAFDPMIAYKKIGEYDDAQRIKQDKSLDIKIGHPNNEYVYAKKKQREDGFLANRKEITGEAYQRSTFFV